jgi:hypothetical protein
MYFKLKLRFAGTTGFLNSARRPVLDRDLQQRWLTRLAIAPMAEKKGGAGYFRRHL